MVTKIVFLRKNFLYWHLMKSSNAINGYKDGQMEFVLKGKSISTEKGRGVIN